MKNIFALCFIIIVSAVFTSCEKVVDINLETSSPKLVVEGIVTDQPGMSYIRLSMSDSYFNVQNPSPVASAIVEITDNNGNTTIFNESAPGFYQPDTSFLGQVSMSYNLKVLVNGKQYTAFATMRKGIEIETVTTKYFDENNSEGKEEGYYVYISFYELPGYGDSYKVDLFVNGQSVMNRPGDLFFFNDKYIDGGHAVDWEFAQKVNKDDTLRLRMYSLTKEGYEFYDAVYAISNAGGLFGKNPANVPTNITGDAFGYFGASAVHEKTAIVQ